jgi:hypothetical protein
MPARKTMPPQPASADAELFAIDSALRKLAPNLARAVSETVSAFFNAQVSLVPAWEAPRIAHPAAIHCSQKNLGEKFEMICNLTADKDGWDRLFPALSEERIRLDAYCELANCICGALVADAAFADWFGYLIPCVPCSGPGGVGEGAYAVNGALRLKGSCILFSFAVREVRAAATRAATLTAAA